MIDECEQTETAPVMWNLPVLGIADKTSHVATAALERILERSQRTEDRIIPMGYAGVPHRLLVAAEADNELTWACTNQWHTGLSEITARHHARPPAPVVLPDQPDPERRTDDATYGIVAQTAAGAELRMGDARAPVVPIASPPAEWETDNGGATGQRYRRMLQRSIAAGLRRARSAQMPLVLHARITQRSDTAAAKVVLELLRARRTPRCSVVALPGIDADPHNDTTYSRAVDGPEPFARVQPLPRLLAASDNRSAGRRSNTRVEQTLRALAGIDPGAPPTEHRTTREIISTMPGEATITADAFDARFATGRLAGLTVGEDRRETGLVLGGQPAVSAVTVDGERTPFEPFSSFSVEGDECRGIHGIERLTPQANRRRRHGAAESAGPAAVTTETLIVGDHDALLLNVTVEWPGWETTGSDGALALLEWTLAADTLDGAMLTYPDGDSRRIRVDTNMPQAGWALRAATDTAVLHVSTWTQSGSPLIVDRSFHRTHNGVGFSLGGTHAVGVSPTTHRFAIVICVGSSSCGLSTSIDRTHRLPAAIRRAAES